MSDTNADSKEVREKIVYKVVHVPYYYPVPVDAEWYYKNYDRFTHQDDFFNPDRSRFEHVMPPPHGFPFPKRKDTRDHHREHQILYADDPDEIPGLQRRSVSPMRYRVSPEETIHSREFSKKESSSPNRVTSCRSEHYKKVKEEGLRKVKIEEHDKNKDRDINNDHENIDDEQVKENEDAREGTEEEEYENENNIKSETLNATNDEKLIEVSRNRKRYLMTFPYDQKKKIKPGDFEQGDNMQEHYEPKDRYYYEEGEKNDLHQKKCDEETPHSHERKFSERYHTMSPEHEGPLSPHSPCVMVPMKSSSYYPPAKMYYEAGYESSRPTHRAVHESSHPHQRAVHESRRTVERDNIYNKRSREKTESRREIRYHPNGRRARTVFTRQQLLTLNNVFEKHPFVSGERMSELSDQLGLDRKIVKIWFQNKRQYSRKKGSSLDREDELYYDYCGGDRYQTPPPPTMAERWQN